MNRRRKMKTVLLTLALFVVSLFNFSFSSTASANFLSAYQVLKQDYSYVVDRIVSGGATEREIEAFLMDLEMEVDSHGTLSEANFNSVMYQSFEEVIQWRVHRNVFRALLDSYGDEIEYTLDNSDLHPDLIPIRNAVMKALLGGNVNPPIVGGGGGVSVPNNAINQVISAALTDPSAIIFVDAAEYPELILPGSLLNEVTRRGKTLELSWKGICLSIPPGAISISGSNKFVISAKSLSQAKEAEIVQKVGGALSLVGKVYEIKAYTLNDSNKFIFSKPVDITLTYDYTEPAEIQKSLALYYYYAQNQNWEKLSGQHALSAREITVTTNHPGTFALFSETGSIADITEPMSKFIDIKGHWAEQDINIMYQKGLISGVTSFQFEPERNITRAEFAAIMLRAMGEQPGNYLSGRFYDVPADSWYFNTVNRAAEIGIISGYSSTSFGPRDSITREQIAAIISRAMQLKARGTAVEKNEREIKLTLFIDQKYISAWARDGVAFAVENNIVKGRTVNQFAPLETATRAEAAAMILRMYNQL